jgi:hypothetical protein
VAARFSFLARASAALLLLALLDTVIYRQGVHTICDVGEVAGVRGSKELLLARVAVDVVLAFATLVLAVLSWHREENRAAPAAPVALLSFPVAAYYLVVWWAIGNEQWGPCTSLLDGFL